MSSASVKETPSAVNTSVSKCQNDIVILHDSVSPRGRLHEEACRSGEEEQGHRCDRVEMSSHVKKDKINCTRFFVIKSLNHQNIQMSIEKGVWATQLMNEPILEEAFQNSAKVILIFSVNMSGFFQGYAQMISSVGWRRDNIWSQGSGKNSPWGRSFKIKWLCLNDLPFHKTLHLKNPWNDFKPVKISRDCQELPEDIGEALCQLLDESNDVDVNKKRSYVESFHDLEDEGFNVAPVHAPPAYPSLFYQHPAETSRFHLSRHIASDVLSNSSIVSRRSNEKQLTDFRSNGSMHRKDNFSQMSSWGLPIGSFTEDEILEMTYEEYVEAYARGFRRLDHSAVGRSASFQKTSSSKERSDDSQSASSSRKRSYRQSLE